MRLPPFLTLTALEAAARHRSYSRAARELHVTHGAVSQQIRKLEEELGATLFVRQGNAMVPTPTGAALAARVSEALGVLREGVDVARASSQGPLVISTSAAFATRWLVTRLGRLSRQTDEPDLQLRVQDRLADFVTDGVDIGLRFGRGPWPGAESVQLLGERLFPVCSPDFLARHPVSRPEDLLAVPRLRYTSGHWRTWFRAMGLEEPAQEPAITFDDTSLMLDAAAQGMGMALARSGLSERDLREGRLVRPFSHMAGSEVTVETGHHFVWRADSPKLARILKLRDWFLAETAEARD